MADQYIDCDKLADAKVELHIDGVALHVLMNALAIYAQYEPQQCEKCAHALFKLAKSTDKVMQQLVEQIPDLVHDHPGDGRPEL